jgi:hypothetical protein
MRSVAAARASFGLRSCEITPNEQLPEFGLSLEDFERMARTPVDPMRPIGNIPGDSRTFVPDTRFDYVR